MLRSEVPVKLCRGISTLTTHVLYSGTKSSSKLDFGVYTCIVFCNSSYIWAVPVCQSLERLTSALNGGGGHHESNAINIYPVASIHIYLFLCTFILWFTRISGIPSHFLPGYRYGMHITLIIGDWVRPSVPIPTISREWKIIDCSLFPPLSAISTFWHGPFLLGKNAQLKPQMRMHIFFVYNYFHVFTIYFTCLVCLVYFETFQCLQSTLVNCLRLQIQKV
jgi:hypothetical protein